MRLLLDTHVALWWWFEDARLAAPTVTAIAEADRVYVSAASAWEIAIKAALGKLEAPEDVGTALDASGFHALDVTVPHALAADALPRHHRDPFDRMLVAQARQESLTLVTADRRLALYEVAILSAA